MSKLEELYTQVCEKLEKETEGIAARQVIAEHLKERCRADVGACMAVLSDAKTLKGAYKAIEDEARARYQKDRSQNGICITYAEGCAIIEKYYGIVPGAYATIVKQDTQAETKSKVVSLFDMF